MRTIKDAAFAWQDKAALRKIREAFDATSDVTSAIATYVALTEIASDEGKQSFRATHGYIAQKSGLARRTVQYRLSALMDLKLVDIQTPDLKSAST